MNWFTMWIIIVLCGVIFYMATSNLPCNHRFDPNPEKPRECRLCGRHAEKHPS